MDEERFTEYNVRIAEYETRFATPEEVKAAVSKAVDSALARLLEEVKKNNTVGGFFRITGFSVPPGGDFDIIAHCEWVQENT